MGDALDLVIEAVEVEGGYQIVVMRREWLKPYFTRSWLSEDFADRCAARLDVWFRDGSWDGRRGTLGQAIERIDARMAQERIAAEALNSVDWSATPGPGGTLPVPGGGIVHLTRCWECQLGQHPGGVHPWADQDDVKHALSQGRPDPSVQVCACDCTRDEPTRPPDGPDPHDLDDSTGPGPCPECGELGACSYDAEGRPLIHALIDDEEAEA